MILTESPRRQLASKLVRWGHWFTFFNILIAITIASLYVFNSRAPDTVPGLMYLFANWFGHIAFITFGGFVILLLPLCYLVPNARIVKIAGALVAASLLALLAFDALMYSKHGVHLSILNTELLRLETRQAAQQFGWQMWGLFLTLFIVWLLFQLFMANALWQRIERFRLHKYSRHITVFFMLCFFSSHATHIWADANLYQPIVHQDDMFPLSYPATAKTIMSKYGMLDLVNYQQRKELQLDQKVGQVKYPAEPVYCSIDNQQKWLVLVVSSDNVESIAKQNNLWQAGHLVNFTENDHQFWFSLLYALPPMYQNAVSDAPILLDLVDSFGMQQAIYSESTRYATSSDFAEFEQQVTNANAGLYLAKVSSQQAERLLAQRQQHTQIMMLADKTNQPTALYTAQQSRLAAGIASVEDIAPTILQSMGCLAKVTQYTTGQNMFDPQRSWLVTTQSNKVILVSANSRFEIDGRGVVTQFDLEEQTELFDPVDTHLLSQAIRHLSRFVEE